MIRLARTFPDPEATSNRIAVGGGVRRQDFPWSGETPATLWHDVGLRFGVGLWRWLQRRHRLRGLMSRVRSVREFERLLHAESDGIGGSPACEVPVFD